MSVNKVNSDGSLSRVAGGTLYADAPIGTISPFGGSAVPSGYLLCDGAEVLKTSYAELYAVIGDAFGTASVNTKFVLPDLRESVPKGAGLTGHTVGNHLDADGLAVGEFIDDRVQDIGKMKSGATSGWTLTAGGVSGYVVSNSNLRTGDTTEVKSVGVNYIIKAKQVAVPFDVAEYIRNQNILSAPEEVTLSNKQHTMEYDGIFTFSIYAYNGSQRVKVSINDVLVINASVINYPSGQAYNSYTVHANKGDIIKIDTTLNLLDTITAQYYKLRDYAGR